MRRKGEKKIIHPPLVWSHSCVIAQAIRSGSGWLDAWMAQQCVTLDLLVKRSKLPRARIDQFLGSFDVTGDEAAALGPALRTDAGAILSSAELSRGVWQARADRLTREQNEASRDQGR